MYSTLFSGNILNSYQSLCVHNVAGISLHKSISLSNSKLDMFRWPHSGHCYIQLTMGKAWIFQPYTNVLQCLALRFVNCHCKSYSDWELSSAPFKCKLLVLGLQRYSWNQHYSVVIFSFLSCDSSSTSHDVNSADKVVN